MKSAALYWAIATAFVAGLGPAAAQTGSSAADDAAAGELVAVQVRQQGFDCAAPVSAKRDSSVDTDAVWTLTCADGKYRVRLVPDQAAAVEKLE